MSLEALESSKQASAPLAEKSSGPKEHVEDIAEFLGKVDWSSIHYDFWQDKANFLHLTLTSSTWRDGHIAKFEIIGNPADGDTESSLLEKLSMLEAKFGFHATKVKWTLALRFMMEVWAALFPRDQGEVDTMSRAANQPTPSSAAPATDPYANCATAFEKSFRASQELQDAIHVESARAYEAPMLQQQGLTNGALQKKIDQKVSKKTEGLLRCLEATEKANKELKDKVASLVSRLNKFYRTWRRRVPW